MRLQRIWSAACSFGIFALVAMGAATAADSTKLDWTPWAELPVRPAFDRKARVMPLDTLAREIVETICGKEYFKFNLAANLTKEELESPAMQPARSLFPGDQQKTFRATPLLMSWLLERDKWDDVPFLRCAHEELRTLLGLPIKNAAGEFILFVSPRQIRESDGYHQHRQELAEKQAAARGESQEFKFTGVDEKFNELFQAVSMWEQLDLHGMIDPESARAFVGELELAHSTWSRVEPKFQFGVNAGAGEANPLAQIQTQVEAARQALVKCVDLLDARDLRFTSLEPAAAEFARATAELAGVFAGLDERARQEAAAKNAGAPGDAPRAALATLAYDSGQLRDAGRQLLAAVYQNSDLLRVVPALNPAALEKDRDPADRSQPWLDLRTVLFATGLRQLGDYPEADLAEVRSSFTNLQRVYLERDARPNDFNASLAGFTGSLRKLGDEITSRIDRLALTGRDEELIREVSYPAIGVTSVEARYNRLNPFTITWGIFLLATALLAMHAGMVRSKWLYAAGLAIVFLGIAWSMYGFSMRVRITGWAPVTNMYETVIYVATLVPLMGLWFALLPATWPGIKRAWPMTAFPFGATGEDNEAPTAASGKRRHEPEPANSDSTVRWLMLLPRLALSGLIFWMLAVAEYADGGRTVFGILPNIDVGQKWPDFSDIVTWVVGVIILVPTVWYGPRVLLSLALSLWTIPSTIVSQKSQIGAAVAARWPFGLIGASLGFITALIAWYAPVLDKDFHPLEPVLRSNFWLLIHVLTIVASYAAGALAWGLGTITLGIYLFGEYREPALARIGLGGHRPSGGGMIGGAGFGGEPQSHLPKRPPEITSEFAAFVYKAIQVAVVLLAAGTILGGVWADRAWGRFWGWDPKEVWALISLLVYLAILHGRYAGWFGNFGLCVGSVLGASAIAFSWYGVNFVLGVGLHSYGFGSGGQYEVGGAVLLSWIFLGAATVRYMRETRGSDPSIDEE